MVSLAHTVVFWLCLCVKFEWNYNMTKWQYIPNALLLLNIIEDNVQKICKLVTWLNHGNTVQCNFQCKHVLAIRLSQAMASVKFEDISDEELTAVIVDMGREWANKMVWFQVDCLIPLLWDDWSFPGGMSERCGRNRKNVFIHVGLLHCIKMFLAKWDILLGLHNKMHGFIMPGLNRTTTTTPQFNLQRTVLRIFYILV